VPVDVDDRALADAARRQRQEAARLHDADVVDEHEAPAGVDVERGSGRARLEGSRGDGPLQGIAQPAVGRTESEGRHRVGRARRTPLQDHAPEVGRLGRLDRQVVRDLDQPVQHVLGLGRGDRGEARPASRPHQEEHAPQERVEVEDAVEQLREHLKGGARHRRVDLQAEAELAHQRGRVEGRVEHAVDAAEGVVDLRPRPVERERDGLRAGVLHPRQRGAVDPRRHRRGQRHRQADVATVRDEVGEVVTLERIAAGEHHQRAGRSEGGDVGQQPPALVEGELERVAIADGVGAAVGADEVAGAGHLPDHEERLLVGVVAKGPHGAGLGAGHGVAPSGEGVGAVEWRVGSEAETAERGPGAVGGATGGSDGDHHAVRRRSAGAHRGGDADPVVGGARERDARVAVEPRAQPGDAARVTDLELRHRVRPPGHEHVLGQRGESHRGGEVGDQPLHQRGVVEPRDTIVLGAPRRGAHEHAVVDVQVRPLPGQERGGLEQPVARRAEQHARALERRCGRGGGGVGEQDHRHRGGAQRPELRGQDGVEPRQHPRSGGRRDGDDDPVGLDLGADVGVQAVAPARATRVLDRGHGRRHAHLDVDVVQRRVDQPLETTSQRHEAVARPPPTPAREHHRAVGGEHARELRGGGAQAQAVDVPGVERAEQRVDDALDHLGAEAPRDRRAHGHVAVVGAPWQERLEGGTGEPSGAEQPGRDERGDAGRARGADPGRQGAQAPVRGEPGGPRARGDDVVGEPELLDQPQRLGGGREHRLRPDVDPTSREVACVDAAARSRPGLEQGDTHPRRDERAGGDDAGDAPSDDGDVRG
jgi:hypothetical protein